MNRSPVEQQPQSTARVSRRKPGRARDARADRAILRATLELISERGASDLRIEDVARRAGVGRATIYRRHASKDALISDVVRTLVSDIETVDTGSLRLDLLALMRAAVRVYSDPLTAGAMPSLVARMHRDREIALNVQGGMLAKRRAALRKILQRGVDRGDLAGNLDFELALDVLAGPLFYRLLITGGPIDERLAQGTVDLLLDGLPAGPRRALPEESS